MATTYFNTLEGESWKALPGRPQYQVSNFGRVVSTVTLTPKLLTPFLCDGYARITLRVRGKTVKPYVHDLVLEAFVGPRPPRMEGCHNNGVRTDNCLDNLRWDTPRSNRADMVRHGTATSARRGLLKGLPTAARKMPGFGRTLTADQVREIRAKWTPRKYSMPKLAKEYGVHRSMIQAIIERKAWAWVR